MFAARETPERGPGGVLRSGSQAGLSCPVQSEQTP